MFSQITNGTCFRRYKICSHQAVHCVIHDRNMFILVYSSTLRSSVDLSETKYVGANVVSLLNAAMPFIPEGLDK